MSSYSNAIMTNHALNSDSSDNLIYLYSEMENEMKSNNKNTKRGQNNLNQHNGYKQHKYSKQYGGANTNENESDVPNGGFPPIFIIDSQEKEKQQSKNRQLTAKKVGVSIRDILKSKK